LLNRIPSPKVLPLLRKLARDAHPWPRVEAVWALGNFQDKESLPLLIESCQKDTFADARKEAILALSRCIGVRVLIRWPEGYFQAQTYKYLQPDPQKELTQMVNFYLANRKLPDCPKLEKEDLPRPAFR